MSNAKTWSEMGWVRLAAGAPAVTVGDPVANRESILTLVKEAAAEGAEGVLLPELALSAYTCADLFLQKPLRRSCVAELAELAKGTAKLSCFVVVGVPLEIDGRLYNLAALLAGGRVVGLVPKLFLPTTGEFYEERWFTSADEITRHEITLPFQDEPVPVGTDLLFEHADRPGLVVGIEICEDLWTVNPPSGDLALAGATILLNPSASPEQVGKAKYRRSLVANQSARCLAAYAYASSGPGESTTDLVYSGHCLIAENGRVQAESERFDFDDSLVMADVDLELIEHERLHNSSFSRSGHLAPLVRRVPFSPAKARATAKRGELLREREPLPFVPRDPDELDEHAEEIFRIQTTGLARRFRHVRCKDTVIGISGGLDSTLALLVVVRAFDRLGLDRKGIHAITMPGLGTTKRTRSNAEKMIDHLGLTKRVIPIAPAVKQHFKDIGHPEDQFDVTYENSQARERTQILMDVANQVGGFVVGTGDLSEMALGWCTFNGDHMSMYHVNMGIPKTLVQFLIKWAALNEFDDDAKTAKVLLDVVDTPISPELLPADKQGRIEQKTEDVIGPYELHDFFLFHIVRHGFGPRKVLYLAADNFEGKYDDATLEKWLRKFLWRFFMSQYKRSACPDGPKIGSVALSPRGDWRMPSDASVQAWIAELDDR